MILGIDASNIRGGGGVTHLVELLKAAEPEKFHFKKVIVWAGSDTLSKISEQKWLEKSKEPLLDKSLFYRIFWQIFLLSKRLSESNCDLLFVPGGTYSGKFQPFVTMSQNLLPFEWSEIRRYGFSFRAFKFIILRILQSRTFLKSDGIIFLTQYARDVVLNQYPISLEKTKIIPHGINKKFFSKDRNHRKFSEFTNENPAKILYVSFIGEYKHQWKVVEGISKLKNKGIPVELILVGDALEKKAYKKLLVSIEYGKLSGLNVKHLTSITYNEIQKLYKNADLFLFASSCETFGQIVTEAMASSIPIACSSLSSMKDLLNENAYYFHPESSDEIADATLKLLKEINTRITLSSKNYMEALSYSWDKCSDDTFNFFKSVIHLK